MSRSRGPDERVQHNTGQLCLKSLVQEYFAPEGRMGIKK